MTRNALAPALPTSLTVTRGDTRVTIPEKRAEWLSKVGAS